MNHPIGPYTADGYYPDPRLIIELDEPGHDTPHAFEHDRQRDRYMAARHIRTMRITDHALDHDRRLAHDLEEALASRRT